MLNLRFLFTSVVFALLSFPVIAWAWFDYLNGGDGWRQGDWLINFGDGLVRRGLIGELLIGASDATGIALLITTQLFQVLLFIAAVFVLWCIALRHSTPLLVLILGISPGFFLTFFAANPMGSMRKESLGILAFALLALCSVTARRSLVLPVCAVVLYTIGCVGNILHSLMLPVFVAGLYFLMQQGRLSKTAFGTLSMVAATMAILWLGFAVMFKEATSLANICAPLLERGMDPEICDHAIRWLVTGEVDHSAQLLQRLTPAALAAYAFVVILCLAPLWLAFGMFAEKRTLLFIILLCFAPLLPLYVTATDWGRWLSLSYTATVLLIIQAQAAGQLNLMRYPDRPRIVALVCVSLLIAPEHSLGWKLGGAATEVARTVLIFI